MEDASQAAILAGKTSLGIELGSTRIKAVLIDENQRVLASGNVEWENQLVDGIWTYNIEDVWTGLQTSFKELRKNVQKNYQVPLKKIGALGISGMMHGYLAFDQSDHLLVPFRTWRNAITGEAAEKLTTLFDYNIPQRWSIAHLYQAILNQEPHVAQVRYLTTLAGYIHWQLTGEKVVGIGEASGMFPIDPLTKTYDATMMAQFESQIAAQAFDWQLATILPKVVPAGVVAGHLTKKGASLLDPSGLLEAGSPLCPPEGDAGTGMVATNSVAPKTGNISAGTSAFAMVVLEKKLQKVHSEIDLVTTPVGDLVAMVHVNNCTSDINAWVKLFLEFSKLTGQEVSADDAYALLFNEALKGAKDCGGLLSYGYYSGENITQVAAGRPLFVRTPDGAFNLANFMRTQLYSAFAVLNIGMKILLEDEKVEVEQIFGHGGIFKTPGVAQQVLAAAIDTPVSVMQTAGVGGAWGIAVLADFMRFSATGQSLAQYLNDVVFATTQATTIQPASADVVGFNKFMEKYEKSLTVEKLAVDTLAL
jgi:sugar (pentulose or hexulose) kinase